MELRKIARNGHSKQVTLPQAFLNHLGWMEHDVVGLDIRDQTIVICRPVSPNGIERPPRPRVNRRHVRKS